MSDAQRDLLKKIEEAFPIDAPPPTVVVPRTSYRDEERVVIQEFFANRPWKDVDAQVFRTHAEAIALMNSEGRRYFYPAWLRSLVVPDDSIASIAAMTSLLNLLRIQFAGEEVFTPVQIDVIAQVIDFYGGTEDGECDVGLVPVRRELEALRNDGQRG
jgi:hypothetical protein